MLDGRTLVLVEVRSRTSAAHGSAAATVGARKQQRFILAARHLLLTRPHYRSLAARFDVVAIDPAPSGGPRAADLDPGRVPRLRMAGTAAYLTTLSRGRAAAPLVAGLAGASGVWPPAAERPPR